ncbi:MAG: sigma-70 family RNA polymerase sigma factor [Oscillospiraceae bacterium]|nr:sigma-70 family RNA polymerase sigma factor [Oscillospiraceae bacterium]MBQ3050166.1 sigma-70 family RNA polymerase sigma factor [Oscillospiraceae bacterium]
MTEFEKIYKDYFNDVFLYIRRLSGDEHVAEEITGETFFKAMKAIKNFRGECDIRVWLCQIAKNCYYTHIKKAGRYAEVEDIEALEAAERSDSVEEHVLSRDEAARIRAVLHDVKDPYKEVFMWRVFADLSFKQIGQIFGKTENWACVTYHRARNMIKERLEEQNREK